MREREREGESSHEGWLVNVKRQFAKRGEAA